MAKRVNKTLEIVKVDIKKLIAKLTTAFADEWMASYQYWVCAKIVRGQLRVDVAAELAIHAQEELAHADLIANRIIQLGGDLRVYPKEWHELAGCKYDALDNTHVASVLEKNIKGEQCAIDFYSDLLKMVEGKDIVTYNMVMKILSDEVEHEQDLIQLLDDLSA